ncbi:uncharacterized protein LOC104336836 [Opisthocomus hoazin]|uniref:uncharacterized protein LOC104336836 n=1 Tax=Opisthocomus hoazin TaxID=30419 RepID=UPI003F53ABA9
MALRGLAVAFLLILAPLLLAQGQRDPTPKNQDVPRGEPGGTKESETCQRPRWGRGLWLSPVQENYKKNEEVMLSCPEGLQPSFTHVKCAGKVLSIIYGKPIYREAWLGKDSSGQWINIQSTFNMECVDVLQVVSETLEISSTSIKLDWICRLPDTCHHIWARCRLEELSSPPCEAKEMKAEEMLQGQEGTFTCSALQPFTVYSVTITLPPSTILYTRLLRTKETVPDKPEKLWLDPSVGSLRWKALPSCKGEIIGYQLNITTRRAHDGSFLEFKQVMVNQSVTQYTPPPQTPGSKYTVTVQGLTAAGAGEASLLEFQTYVSDGDRGCGHREPDSAVGRMGLAPVCACKSRGGSSTLPLKKMMIPTPAEGRMEGSRLVEQASRPSSCVWEMGQVPVLQNLPLPCPTLLIRCEGRGTLCLSVCPCGIQDSRTQTHVSTDMQTPNAKVGATAVAGQPLGSWPGSAVMVVVVVVVLVPLFAGILWFVLSRRRKALPSKAEEDHYTELQPYENLDNYCVIRETRLAQEDAGERWSALPVPTNNRERVERGSCDSAWSSTTGSRTPYIFCWVIAPPQIYSLVKLQHSLSQNRSSRRPGTT